MNPVTYKAEFESMLKEVARLTNINHHNYSRLEIAEFFEFETTTIILKLIIQIHDIQGYMPSSLITYRDVLTTNMFIDIKALYGDCFVTELNSNL